MIIRKVLIVRFNSIGDIVLTSPVIRALDKEGYEVHYLSKRSYRSLLKNNPRVKKYFALDEDLNEVLTLLKEEGYTYIVDLHNNYRSRKVRQYLKLPTYTLRKHPLRLFLMTQLHVASKQQEHIIDRFLSVVTPLLDNIQKPKVEFYIPNNVKADIDKLALELRKTL